VQAAAALGSDDDELEDKDEEGDSEGEYEDAYVGSGAGSGAGAGTGAGASKCKRKTCSTEQKWAHLTDELFPTDL
jgi:hypothetical protein